MNYSKLTDTEKELIFGKELSLNKVGRTLKNNVLKFYDTLKDHEHRKKIKEEEDDFPYKKIEVL